MITENEGDCTAACALGMARRAANNGRLSGFGVDDFSRGLYIGQCIVAYVRLDADPIIMQAAENEIFFLCTRYARGEA